MTDRPILFSGEMVRAILDGRKTQTRRVVQARRFDAADVDEAMGRDGWGMVSPGDNWTPDEIARDFPNRYGKSGDRLWVRETLTRSGGLIQYAADTKTSLIPWPTPEWKQDPRPSIHMPRWASRLTLEITNVRVERLQAISPIDVDAEGVWDCGAPNEEYIGEYAKLWDALNAKRGYGWDVNPWVWVIEFRSTPHEGAPS